MEADQRMLINKMELLQKDVEETIQLEQEAHQVVEEQSKGLSYEEVKKVVLEESDDTSDSIIQTKVRFEMNIEKMRSDHKVKKMLSKDLEEQEKYQLNEERLIQLSRTESGETERIISSEVVGLRSNAYCIAHSHQHGSILIDFHSIIYDKQKRFAQRQIKKRIATYSANTVTTKENIKLKCII